MGQIKVVIIKRWPYYVVVRQGSTVSRNEEAMLAVKIFKL